MTVTVGQLERQRAELLARVDGWSAARLNFRPGEGQWSALEMFDHLVKTESGIAGAARRGLQAPHPVSVVDRAKFAMLEKLFTTAARVKVPAAAAAVLPRSGLVLDEVLLRWNTAHEQIASLIAEEPEGMREQGVFRHPVSGWMSVSQVMRFFSVHMVHHTFQLERIAEASGKE